MRYEWEYRGFGDFTYNVLPQPQIKPFLMEWVMREWETDHAEFPDQPWTLEWLDLLPRMEFAVEAVRLDAIALHPDLMGYRTERDDFAASLEARADDREESLLRGVSTEPLLVNGANMQLMDGYTRYVVLKRHNQDQALAYVGRLADGP